LGNEREKRNKELVRKCWQEGKNKKSRRNKNRKVVVKKVGNEKNTK